MLEKGQHWSQVKGVAESVGYVQRAFTAYVADMFSRLVQGVFALPSSANYFLSPVLFITPHKLLTP